MTCNKNTPLFDALPSCTESNLLVPNPEAGVDDCKFELCDREEYVLSLWAMEHVEIAGVDFQLFHLDFDNSVRDPLYDEAIERVFQGAFDLKGFLEYPESTPEATESGLHASWECVLWIPRLSIEENNAPTPGEGDTIRVWGSPFFKKYSVLEQDIPDSGYFFDVIKVDEDGHIFDQAGFVGFKCNLKRKTEFTPERRLAND